MSTATRQLLELSRKLPADKVRELADFAEFLLVKSAPHPGRGPAGRRTALRRYIGGVKHGALASGIDDELYGRPVH